MRITLLTVDELVANAAGFAALLRDAVAHGASIGFVLPLEETEVGDYWAKVGAELASGRRLLLAAADEAGRIVGSAQLALESRSNGRHRAEVQKVLVLSAARGRGLGSALMARLESEASAAGRRLLFLDTSTGAGGAADFYKSLGYLPAGGIPDYATDPDGRLRANAIFYKRLP